MKQQSPRARILAMAEVQFIAHGYAHTTMDQLAGELGISKRTLYEYYGSKEKLFYAVIQEKARELSKAREEILRSKKNVIDKLLLVGQMAQRSYATMFNANLFNDVKRNAPALWQKIKNVRQEKVRTMWEEILEQGIRSGEFRKELNVDFVISTFVASLDKLLEPEYLLDGQYSMAHARQLLIDLFLNGLCTTQGRKSVARHAPIVS